MALLWVKVSRSEVSSIPKNTFSVWICWRNRLHTSFLGLIGYLVRSEQSFVHPKKHVFSRNFLTKPAPNLFSGPNWLYGAFGGKIVTDESFAQFCLKSRLKFVFPKNTFSIWIFVLNRPSPIFLAKRTRWRDWGKKCPGAKCRPSQKTRFRPEFF